MNEITRLNQIAYYKHEAIRATENWKTGKYDITVNEENRIIKANLTKKQAIEYMKYILYFLVLSYKGARPPY